MTSKTRVKAHYDRMVADGYKQVKVWCKPEHTSELKRLAVELDNGKPRNEPQAQTPEPSVNTYISVNPAPSNISVNDFLDANLDAQIATLAKRFIEQQITIQSITKKGKN